MRCCFAAQRSGFGNFRQVTDSTRGRPESPEIRKGKIMIRLQDIADMAGVSRTTVSNVLHGNTKRVSQKTVDKIKKILEENEYQPNIGSMMLTGKGSRIIGFVIGYSYTHGHPSMMDPFISALLASIQDQAEKAGYYIMIIGGSEEKHILEIASRWNVDGLIFIGYSEARYRQLRRRLNKKAVLVDTYTLKKEYDYQNVGIDDWDGGYQMGEYLLEMGYPEALFIGEETRIRVNESVPKLRSDKIFSGLCNEKRWQGFKAAMEKKGGFCSIRRFITVSEDAQTRKRQYERMLPQILNAGALGFGADYNAIEMMNFLHDRGIRVPDQVSIVGFDDCVYAEYVRPRLTTIHQDVAEKGAVAFDRLKRMIEGETLSETYVFAPVKLIVRDSVRRHIVPEK